MITIHKYETASMGENTYALVNDQGEALIVDPGDLGVVDWIGSLDIQPQAIILTHAHSDHIEGLDAVRDAYDIPAYIHPIEEKFVEDPRLNLSAYMPGTPVANRPIDHTWEAMGPISLAGFNFRMAHVPGHSPGSVVYIFDDEDFAIVGDTVFQGSIGRTDFPGGSYDQLMNGIQQEIMTLPDHYTLYPGHGPATTVQVEKTQNPFILGLIR
ncbi:MBL fold metallo-hydrolase [Hutsoniella sourekii]|uniref:MBL fold metallo-hydrolase n=1 Tax=Hutsoniella sourekii TaxID=87650 RepID=UPI0004B8EE80|nr:MBL fold metallo-hydrolase [Hutsoniella sourekii]